MKNRARITGVAALLFMTTPLSLFADCSSSNDQFTSRSAFFVEPLFHSVFPEMVSGFRFERVHARNQTNEYPCSHKGFPWAFQLALVGGVSNISDSYFLPPHRTSLIIGEQPSTAPDNEMPDVLAQQLGIKTKEGTFYSRIALCPKQTAIALGFLVRASFWRNDETRKGFFIEASAPLTHVKNDLNFIERVINNGGGVAQPESDGVTFVANATQAFRQESWMYSKIDGAQTKTGIGDAELKIGYEWLDHAPCHLETYAGILLPLGNNQKAEYLFEPVVGFGGHFGWMFGSGLGIEVWKDEATEGTLRVEQATHSQFLFKRNQQRTFDLLNKPWSRFMQVYADEQQAQEALNTNSVDLATPGVNVFTREFEVTPGFMLNTNTAIVYYRCMWHLEAGYNFFAKQAESIELACDWDENVALKHYNGTGLTTTTRTISGDVFLTDEFNHLSIPLDDYEQAVISLDQLDINSASAPSVLAHTIYGAIGQRWDHCEYPVMFDIGASYMFGHNSNATPRRWLVWGKCGVSF